MCTRGRIVAYGIVPRMTKLPPDPVIDEIREVRHQISADLGHDPKRLIDHYMKLQERHKERSLRPTREPGESVQM
jgi:hypothetical protein